MYLNISCCSIVYFAYAFLFLWVGSSLKVLTGLWTAIPENMGSVSIGSVDFLFAAASISSLRPTSVPCNGHRDSGKSAGRDVKKVKKDGDPTYASGQALVNCRARLCPLLVVCLVEFLEELTLILQM